MAEPFRPAKMHHINPRDATGLSSFPDDQPISHIRSLTIFTEAASGELRFEFINFLARLHALEVIVIHWKALNWFQLGEAGLRAFVRLFSLPSLTELQVSASANFPLCLLKYFTGKKLSISVNANPTSVVPLHATSISGRENSFLEDLSVCGTRNMQEIRTYAEWQSGNAQKYLRSIKCLRCYTSWRDSGAKPEEVMRVLGTFLFRVVDNINNLEEFHFSDLQLNYFNGFQATHFDLQRLTSLRRLHLELGASPKANEGSMNSMDSTLRKWLLPLLFCLPSQGLLEVIHITFSFVVPFPWPMDLHDWMLTISATLEGLMLGFFTQLQVATLKFDLHNAHTRPFDWKDFNEKIRPRKLISRGVDCIFKAEVYLP